jgi:DNA-binding CsgD family transcriptional regulator
MPPQDNNSRNGRQQKNNYHFVLGSPLRLVNQNDPAAQENFQDKNVLAGHRRSTDKDSMRLSLCWDTFSAREKEVTILVCEEGLTDAEIASRLNISYATVKSYLQRIFFKANVRNRRALYMKFKYFHFPR